MTARTRSSFGRIETSLFLAIAAFAPACGGGPVMSGMAVAKIGGSLSEESRTVPRGAALCGYQEALGQPSPTGADKPMSEACKKASENDKVWRGSMAVLGAYSAKLEALAWGANPELAGKIDGALTGIHDASWAQPEGADEKAAADAAFQLANELQQNPGKRDLGDTIKTAAPHVKTICDGLGKYLDAQVKASGDAQTDVEKRRTQRADRRCALLDGKNICVQESVLDRMTYAASYGDLDGIHTSHAEASHTVAAFCAAHLKLEAAAASGDLKSDKTYQDVVDAASSAQGGSSAGSTDAKPAGGDAKPAGGDAKPAEKN